MGRHILLLRKTNTPRIAEVDEEEVDKEEGKADPKQDPQAAPLGLRKHLVREKKAERLDADEGDAGGGQARRTLAAAEHAYSTPWSKRRVQTQNMPATLTHPKA